MQQPIAPIPVRPWTLNGISERMLVSHYENVYGVSVRTLNAVRQELAELDARAPGHRLRSLKQEELLLTSSVALHELYFANLGGEGNKIPEAISTIFEEHFGSVSRWRAEFVALAHSLAGASGWVLLTWSRREQRFLNAIAADHAHGGIDTAPVLVLDMYEHAYVHDFDANVTAYVDAFMRNVNWPAVVERINAVRGSRALPVEDLSDPSLPSISVEELAAQLAAGEKVQVLDARPRHYISRNVDQMQGAVWHDPDQVDAWAGELSRDEPVAVYCAYGFHVGCNVTRALRERGFDARFIRGGVSAWYAAGGSRSLRPPDV